MELVFDHIYRNPAGEMNLIPALKLAMQLRGICTSCTAPPWPPLTPEHVTQVTSKLATVLNVAGVDATASVATS